MPLERLLSHGDAPVEILPLLVDDAVDHLGAAGAAIVGMGASGEGRVVASRGVPRAIADWSGEVETIDRELGALLAARAPGAFGATETLPLVSGHDIFGALVLFYASDSAPSEARLELARSLATLAAMSLAKARQYEELSRSYAELRASRLALERTEKLRALGQMAAGISHDLKNILNPLSLHLQLLRRAVRAGQPVTEASVEEMRQIVRRGVETLERLRAFSRQAPDGAAGQPRSVSVDAVASEALELARPRLRSSTAKCTVILSKELGSPPPVLAQSADFVAAILNLVVNAIDAAPAHGHVTVITGAEGGGSYVRVKDDGPGVPEDVQGRIFEPFFTTKGAEGTGLGLAMAYAFTQRHGGRLTLDSTPAAGTVFTLWLPAAPDG